MQDLACTRGPYPPSCITWWIPLGLFVYCIWNSGIRENWMSSGFVDLRHFAGSAVPCSRVRRTPAASSAGHLRREQSASEPLPQ